MKKYRMALTLLLAALLLALPGLAEEISSPYVENEWNFVDGSLDVSGGIPSDAEGTLADIRERGLLRVATEPYFPPYEFIDPALTGQEQYMGADMELARLIARRMGVELEIVPMEFTQVLPAVAERQCDLAISGLSFTPARAAMVEMSKGYHYTLGNAGSGLMIRQADGARIRNIGDLKSAVILAQAGSLQEALAADNIYEYRQFRRMPTMQEVYAALEEGRADAAIVDIENAQSYIAANPDCGLTVVPEVRFILEEQFDGDRIAGPKGETMLMYFVNGVIDEVLEDGHYQSWFSQYTVYASKLDL